MSVCRTAHSPICAVMKYVTRRLQCITEWDDDDVGDHGNDGDCDGDGDDDKDKGDDDRDDDGVMN